MADYIPQNEGQLVIWLANYQTKLATYGAALGLTPAEITALSTACTNLVTLINAVEAAKTALKNAVEAKDAGKDTGLGLIRSENKRMKTNAGYTDAIGEDMGVKGSTEDMDKEAAKPKLTGDAFPGYVRLKFTKKGLDGVNIYARLKGQTGWNFLARDTNSPYDDNRPLAAPAVPETREYMCIGVISDTEVGQASDIVSVVFGG
jgi:hypothetical protein